MLAILLYLAIDHVTYVDASGARCHAFEAEGHEIDLCYGKVDRDASVEIQKAIQGN